MELERVVQLVMEWYNRVVQLVMECLTRRAGPYDKIKTVGLYWWLSISNGGGSNGGSCPYYWTCVLEGPLMRMMDLVIVVIELVMHIGNTLFSIINTRLSKSINLNFTIVLFIMNGRPPTPTLFHRISTSPPLGSLPPTTSGYYAF